MANPSGTGNHQEQHTHVNPSSFNGNSAPESSSGLVMNMKHNPGISLDWTPEEQATLEDGLSKYEIFYFYNHVMQYMQRNRCNYHDLSICFEFIV